MRALWNKLRAHALTMFLIAGSWSASGAVAASSVGCHDSAPAMTPEQVVKHQEIKAETSYTLDLMNCTAVSKTKAESKACEDLADIRWNVAEKLKAIKNAPAKTVGPAPMDGGADGSD